MAVMNREWAILSRVVRIITQSRQQMTHFYANAHKFSFFSADENVEFKVCLKLLYFSMYPWRITQLYFVE